MRLTCVTAVFNAIEAGNRERLVRCVESVAALKTEHEHLIYDGASSDGTVELLRELEVKTPGLKVVSEPDAGIYNALNKGVRDAQGEWFYVLGCDDYICRPEVMDALLGASDCADVVVTDAYTEASGATKIRPIDCGAVLWLTPYCHQGVLMRHDVVKRYRGFDENYRIAADYKLFLMCHLDGVDIACRPGERNMFASFGMNGLSESNQKDMYHEFDMVLAEVFGLDVGEVGACRARRCLPLRIFLRFVNSRDLGLRTSSRKMVRAWCRHYVRLLLLPIVILTRPLRVPRSKRKIL